MEKRLAVVVVVMVMVMVMVGVVMMLVMMMIIDVDNNVKGNMVTGVMLVILGSMLIMGH